MLTPKTAKKPYGYQVNCHLKFGDSLHFKIKQTIKSEDEQESKKKQKKQQHKKKSTTIRKRSALILICIKQAIFVSFFKQKR